MTTPHQSGFSSPSPLSLTIPPLLLFQADEVIR